MMKSVLGRITTEVKHDQYCTRCIAVINFYLFIKYTCFEKLVGFMKFKVDFQQTVHTTRRLDSARDMDQGFVLSSNTLHFTNNTGSRKMIKHCLQYVIKDL